MLFPYHLYYNILHWFSCSKNNNFLSRSIILYYNIISITAPPVDRAILWQFLRRWRRRRRWRWVRRTRDRRPSQESQRGDDDVLWNRVVVRCRASGEQAIAALQQPSCSRPHGCCWSLLPVRRWPASTPNASAAIPSTHHRRPCPRRPTTRRPPAMRSSRPQPPRSTDTGVGFFSIFSIHFWSFSLSLHYERL